MLRSVTAVAQGRVVAVPRFEGAAKSPEKT
jgi:hypothetical protein